MVPRTAPALKLGSIAGSLADEKPHCAAWRRAKTISTSDRLFSNAP